MAMRLERETGFEPATACLEGGLVWRGVWVAGRSACHQDVASSRISTDADAIDFSFPELISTISQPLYEAFDFYTLDLDAIRAELERMQKRTWRYASA